MSWLKDPVAISLLYEKISFCILRKISSRNSPNEFASLKYRIDNWWISIKYYSNSESSR